MASLRKRCNALLMGCMARSPRSQTGKPSEGLVQIRVTRGERTRLQSLARKRGLAVSDLMREAIECFTATDVARPDLHLRIALERLCEEAGVSPNRIVDFFDGLTRLIHRPGGAEESSNTKRRR